MFTTKEEIQSWLDKMQIYDYTIHDDLTVDVDGNVGISNQNLIDIPIQFSIVTGNFTCSKNKLKSLKGSPYVVHGTFECAYNDLIDLKYAPAEIHGHFMFQGNKVQSLKHGPNIVSGEFSCGPNPIKSLEGLDNISTTQFSHWATNPSNFIPRVEKFYEACLDAKGKTDGWMLILEKNQLEIIKKQIKLYLELSVELNNVNEEPQKKIKL